MNRSESGDDSGTLTTPATVHDAWSRYWAQGVPHSCIGSYGDCYGGAIAEFWCEVFGELQAGARVLDVATGNGALPRLLLKHCPNPEVSCDGVDIASIAPNWLAAALPNDRNRVRFHGQVDAGELPFGDGCFDLVISQYGFEYTDVERSLPELLRVLAPSGSVALVLHHSGGRPATLALAELAHLDWMMKLGGLLDAAAAMVEPMARAATAQGRASLDKDTSALATRERFNALLSELASRAERVDGADILFDVRNAVMAVLAAAGKQGKATADDRLLVLKHEFAHASTRLRDLLAHTVTEAAVLALQTRLNDALHSSVMLDELREQGHLMGWTLRSSRP